MEIPKKIQEAIKNNRLVIFAGSGLSTKFNLPSWKQLVVDVIAEIGKQDYNVLLPVLEVNLMNPAEVLEKLKPEHNTIKKYIKNNFQTAETNSSLHKNILELSGQIITTNFDNAFEIASNNSITPAVYTSEFNISEINKSNEKYIFKLHGTYMEPDHCIIFKDQYENLYANETGAVNKLKSIFSDKVILFLGFSFNDPDISLIFNNLDKAFKNNNKHFILTKEPKDFEKYNFLEQIKINEYNEIDLFIETCLKHKEVDKQQPLDVQEHNNVIKPKAPRIALLSPNPLDINLQEDLSNIADCFDGLEANIYLGTLNIRTLGMIDDYDAIIISSKVYKTKLYIEDDNLKSNLMSPQEICSNIPNENIPVIFITNEKIEPILTHPNINISTLRRQIIKRFIYKALQEGRLDFKEGEEVSVYLTNLFNTKFSKGKTNLSSIYNNNKNLAIGKKSLTSVIGRIEEQSALTLKVLSIAKSNKLLNVKASGGIGKTTLIKKVAYELYNRGYYREGVNFESCENVKSFGDFEEILIRAFNLTNILNFKEYLVDNFKNSKIDLLIILDNFETVVNNLNTEAFNDVLELLKFTTDYANIIITSREKLVPADDFEDVYSLTPLVTDDALALFEKNYGNVTGEIELKILRQEILEDLLNNNPLAIKLVTKSRTRLKSMVELRDQLKEHFFESINEDYSLVFNENADLNIERTKSIYQSINYSYTTLSPQEKIAFELLSLFPDGISLTNFRKCFQIGKPSNNKYKEKPSANSIKNKTSNEISDSDLRVLRDKSLVEDYNGILQLQPITRRFSDYQFSKRPKDHKKKYCRDAYAFNSFILELIDLTVHKKSDSEALRLFNLFKHNLINVLNYIRDIEIIVDNSEPQKKYLLNYIYGLADYFINEKQVSEFHQKLKDVQSHFSDLPNAETLIKVINLNLIYYNREFDKSYTELSEILSIKEMEERVLSKEDYIENRYKNIISSIHSMEGYTIQRIRSLVFNDDYSTRYLDAHFFYLGIIDTISRKKDGFYYYEYELMLGKLNVPKLEEYIHSLYSEEHLEIMQSTYTLSKVKIIERKTIQKLVVTNPYTRGLKELMYAFISVTKEEKIKHFEEALINLKHIKYYYLEALYHYCLFLKDSDNINYSIKLVEGIDLSSRFYFQYLNFLFSNIENPIKPLYTFSYAYYNLPNLESFVQRHNEFWIEKLKKYEED